MKKICETFEVSRSQQYVRLNGDLKPRKKRYQRKEDSLVLEKIKEVIQHRETYGYKRTTVLVNRKYAAQYNQKRIYRLMDMHGLLVPKNQYSVKKDGRKHEGKVSVLKSNMRWCSDSFQIKCWNGEKVHVAFSMDCCDREAIEYVAYRRPLISEDVMDLMANSHEKRKSEIPLGRKIQWLTDNGKIYVCSKTVFYGKSLGLIPCTTPHYSPESNGIAEAFVKTFKRDYVYVNDVSNADTVLRQLSGWFSDYNAFAPHSALKMKSPLEFREKMLNN